MVKKEFIRAFIISLIATWALQNFVINKWFAPVDDNAPLQVGESFSAKTRKDIKPLNTQIDFIDGKRSARVQETQVDTPLANYVFSTDGATLERVLYKRMVNGKTTLLGTLFPPSETDKENRCFLVGFDEKTPYYYQLVSRTDNEQGVVLTYQAQTPEVTVEKIFTIHTNVYQIDLDLRVTPHTDASYTPRVLFPAPLMPELGVNDGVVGLVTNYKGSLEKIVRNKVDENSGWFRPVLFGAMDKYFVSALVRDPQRFMQRAYYKLVGHNELISIIEGGNYKQAEQWKLTFYFGPKDEQAIKPVAPELEQALDYSGWLAPIARWLMALLEYIYSYVHNYGWAIVIMTILFKLLLMPFSWVNPNDAKKKQAELQKKLAYIQHKYKDDPATLAQERAALIAKHGMPGAMGCLPMLLQIPIFFALNKVLTSSFQLYKSPFLIWNDLSATDPYYILPVLIAGFMFMQAMVSEPNQRVPLIITAMVFGALSMYFSVGLALFFALNTIIGVLQVMWQTRKKVA